MWSAWPSAVKWPSPVRPVDGFETACGFDPRRKIPAGSPVALFAGYGFHVFKRLDARAVLPAGERAGFIRAALLC